MNDSLVLASELLEVRFQRQGDRWMHVVAVRHNAMEPFVPVLHSIEGNAEQPWPPSPPWQEVRIEQISTGAPVLLAVGMAGSSHWSLAVEIDATAHHVQFDVACRTRAADRHLGSCYRLTEPTSAVATNVGLRLGSGSPVTVIAGDDTALHLRDGDLVIEPTAAASVSPATLRWRYTLETRFVHG